MDSDAVEGQEEKTEEQQQEPEADPYHLMKHAKLKKDSKQPRPRPTDAEVLALVSEGMVPDNCALANLPKPFFNAYHAARRRIQRANNKKGRHGGGLVHYHYTSKAPGAGFNVLSKDLGVPHTVLSNIARRFMDGAHDNQK
jgi:hypothetical protein